MQKTLHAADEMKTSSSHPKGLLKRLTPRSVDHFAELMQFFYLQRHRGFQIPDEPTLDPPSQALFGQALARCTNYLEYGSGGSTVLAARAGKSVICVDSDPYFLKEVEAKIGNHRVGQQTLDFLYCDIGLTAHWGKPVFRKPTAMRLERWKHYPRLPWDLIARRRLAPPDLILIDGRFRVACALTSFLHLQDHPETTVLVDDFVGRRHYAEIERFGTLVSCQGRMGVFQPRHSTAAELQQAIEASSADWR